MRTKSAEQKLIAATKSPATAAEAHYWLGRIYDFKGNKAEGAFPGFHEEVSIGPRAEAEFKAAGTPKPDGLPKARRLENALKAADAAIAKLQSDPSATSRSGMRIDERHQAASRSDVVHRRREHAARAQQRLAVRVRAGR